MPLILGYLGPEEADEAARTCFYWSTIVRMCPSLKLKRMKVAEAIKKCSKNNLTELDLTNCHLPDPTFNLIAGLPALKKITFDDCAKVRARTIATLGPLENLESLNLPNCEGVNDRLIACAVAKFKKLKSLDLHDCTKISDAALASIAGPNGLDGLKDLRKLNLSGCPVTSKGLELLETTGITHLTIKQCWALQGTAFVEKMGSLVSLQLARYYGMSDNDLAAISRASNLQHLDVSYCPRITDAGVVQLTQLPLKTLEIVMCDKITGEGWVTLLQGLTQLLSLNASCNKFFTDQAIEALSPTIEELEIDYCPALRQRGVLALGALINLRKLCIAGSDALDSKSIATWTRLRSLEKLVLNRCMQVNANVLRLVSTLPVLVLLSIEGCAKVTSHALRTLADGAPSLRRLNLAECYRIDSSDVNVLMVRPLFTTINLHSCQSVKYTELVNVDRVFVIGKRNTTHEWKY